MNYKILIAEDDNDISSLLKIYLENIGMIVLEADNGEKAMTIFKNSKIDIVLLDIMLPKLDGYSIIKKIRKESEVPIIVISAKGRDEERILGLDLGADDYISKPFNPLEVCARVKAQLRRIYKFNKDKDNHIIIIGDLKFNVETFRLFKKETEIFLTPMEYKILSLLMQSPNKVFTKNQIYELIKGNYFDGDENAIMVHISNLREKIEDDHKKHVYIKTIRGLGYKFEKK